MSPPIPIVEVPLAAVAPGGELAETFREQQASWIDAGITRWLALLRPDGSWPAAVLVARQGDGGSVVGTVAAVWAPTPLDRFDDLLEGACRPPHVATDRPEGGVWHLIAASVPPRASVRGLGIGRRLVSEAIAWARRASPGCRVMTLSPVVGLPELAACVGAEGDPFGARARLAVRYVSDAKGKPALPIVRLHLGAGARLDAILLDSRADEVRSGGVTLRFAYPADPADRVRQRQAYLAWVETCRGLVAQGDGAEVCGPRGRALRLLRPADHEILCPTMPNDPARPPLGYLPPRGSAELLARRAAGERHLARAELAGADLTGADLRGLDLEQADLRGALLGTADLARTDLRGADLRDAWLERAHLKGARLAGARLDGANLRLVSASDADLEGATLARADLSGAGLFRACLDGASLRGADLEAVNLSRASLVGTELEGARLASTVLGDVDLADVRLAVVRHDGPSLLGTRTIVRTTETLRARGASLASWADFLRACGEPDAVIDLLD